MPSTVARTLTLNPRQRRTFLSSLFGLTFLASVLTVSASAILPCPAHRGRYADGSSSSGPASAEDLHAAGRRGVTVVDKKPRRWIEETRPAPKALPPL